MPYQHQIVRDLAWVIESPDLIKGEALPFSTNITDYHDWLDALDNDPTALKNHLAKRTRNTLGHYFESLYLFWCQHIPGVSDIQHHIQLQDDKRTIGEIDLLFRLNGVVYHIELSCKFYLNIGNSTLESYIGPGAKDNLDKRMKTFARQCSVLEDDKWHDALGITGETITPLKVVKGWLFYDKEVEVPADLNPTHNKGSWHAYNALPTINNETRITLLHKPHWLSPHHQTGDHGLYSPADFEQYINDYFAEHKRPLLAAYLAPHKSGFVEYKRAFIVPEGWPDVMLAAS